MDGKPIAFASKALTDQEKNYANIECELLAVVFGCERFHTYVFGAQFIVESDHKPLVSIQHKPLSKVPPRLQRLKLRLQPYNVEIAYKPGKDMVFADMLSRTNPTPGPTIQLDQTIHMVTFSTEKKQLMKAATDNDEITRQLRQVILDGWPEKASDLPRHLRQFWSSRDMMSVEDGLVMRGEQIVVPEALRGETLDRLHTGHQGVTKCQLRSKSTVFWPGINRDIETTVARCPQCQRRQRTQQHEPLQQHEIPTRSWHTVGTDLFDFYEEKYLIIVDYY